jgi:signal peptidase II
MITTTGLTVRGINMEFLYIALIIIADQFTKYIAKTRLMPLDNVDLIPGYFSLSYVENRGAAFGLFQNNKMLLVGVTAIVILFIFYYLIKNRGMNIYLKLSLVMITAGAIGNLIDRIFLGYVVDFFHFYIKSVFDWPVFNVADISVVCGTILLSIVLLFVKE